MCIKKEEKKFFEMESGLITHNDVSYKTFNRRCSFSRNVFYGKFPSISKKLSTYSFVKISDKLGVLETDFTVSFFYKKN